MNVSPNTAEPSGSADSNATAPPPRAFDIVVIGASAGGLRPLRALVAALPEGYGGAIFVVVHTDPEADSHLADILTRSGPVPARLASDGQPIVPGHIHVAPPDFHLLLEAGVMRVLRGPRENRHRPAVDPLFRSAGWLYGPRVVGVLLSGNLDDGTAGLWAVKSCGGTTVVQEPDEAQSPGMPTNALRFNRVDHRLRAADIGALLARRDRAREAPPAEPAAMPGRVGVENALTLAPMADRSTMDRLGMLSPFTCPSCGGALWELEEPGGHLHYRCHTGHAVTQAGLLIEQGSAVEDRLYRALRAVQEKAMALRRLADRWPEHLSATRDDYLSRAADLDETAVTLRRVLAGTRP